MVFLTSFFTTFLLSLVLSIDDMVVGVSYGLRKAKMPLRTMAIVLGGSTLSMAAAMALGKVVLGFMGHAVTKYLSMLLLIGLGCWILYQSWRKSKDSGLIRETAYYRWNGRIGLLESLYLGLALGIDDFAEALGLSFAGFPVALTVALFKISEIIAIYSGYYLSYKQLSKHINGKLGFFPGLILILVGLWQVIG